MRGYPDGKFHPDSFITRAEVAAMLVNLKALTVNHVAPAYPDVLPTFWGADPIAAVTRANLMTGYPNNEFRPNAFITRAEFVVTMNRVLGRGPLIGRPARWSDVPLSYWAFGQIQEASISHTWIRQPDGSESWTADVTNDTLH